ncbi:uncharacterized protein AB9W97_005626 isoform 3-T3 [Spinachia spinachia]
MSVGLAPCPQPLVRKKNRRPASLFSRAMSWAEEDWTVGLSGRVLQKVKELQVHQERLSRENKQKQLQLDNIHTSLEKQTAKYEEIRGELQYQQRELREARQEGKAAVTSNERLTNDLQTKQAQVCSLQGQVAATRTLNNKLTLEIKRLEAELEKLQNGSRSADATPFSTPGCNATLPWEHNGSRTEERPGYREEGQTRGLHVRLQFSKDGSNSLPRTQPKITAQRHSSDQSDIFSTPSAVFPWEQDDSRPAARRLSPSSPQAPGADVNSQDQLGKRVCENEKDRKTAADTASLTEAWSRVTALEVDLCAKAGALKSIQSEMVQSKKELGARELSLQKARDELSMAHSRVAQESDRASAAEQKLKHLLEELKCQRQNAESSRLQHQQRSKELEKQHQRDVTELQRERQCLEKQHLQEVNKLNVALQQARTLHNTLQAQADKLSLQKQELNKALDTLKEKLKWTEGQLQESQKKEAQTQAKLTEALREAEGVAVTLEQSRKRESALEEEGRKLGEERIDALRLLKELREQKAVPATPLQPVQFCSVGKGFSPQPSYSPTSKPAPHIKRSSVTALAEQKSEEDLDVDKRRAEMAASYPSDREPGEGIDSEHITDRISPESECLQMGRHGSNEVVDRRRSEGIERDSSGTNKHPTFDQGLTTATHSAPSTPPDKSVVCDRCKASEDLRRENATLRSELHDSREELQKRLQDLEAQRRAETEARTRLKQLGRKCSSVAVEKTEQDKEWRAQLETERAETEKLRKAMAALETEITRGREERDKRETEEQYKAADNRESEMIELNIQMKQQLAQVKAQLALEKEERKREEEERNQLTTTDIAVKKELRTKLEDLRAELKELKSRREEYSLGVEKLSLADSPLTYLDLRGDDLNANVVHCDNKPLPSPERHLLFCQSTNQHNMLVSQPTADLVQEMDPELSSPSDDGQTVVITCDRQNYVGGSPLSHLQKVEPASADLTQEVVRLQNEKTMEAERAHQCQVKLEVLQSQVTLQTKQLTMAFEKQSRHISGLLVELQEKESTLLAQGEELQRYKQELAAFKAAEEAEEKKREEMMIKEVEDGEQQKATQYERTVDISGLQTNQEKESLVTVLATNSLEDSGYDAHRDQLEIVTVDAGRPKPFSTKSDGEVLRTEEQPPSSRDRTLSSHNSAEDAASADMDAELLALRQEIRLLKRLVGSVAPSDPGTPAFHTDSGKREDASEHSNNTGSAALSCSAERSSQSAPDNIGTDARQPRPQDVERIKDEGDPAMENWTTKAEEELEAMPELHIKPLQQQVKELQRSLRSLSAETEQQAEELVRWRLSAQPAPTFDQWLPNTDNQYETQDQIPAAWNQRSGVVSVVREDELFLSCSSSTVQGRLLSSRLQNSKLPEQKTLKPSGKTAALQECDQIVQESEEENHEISLSPQLNTCQTQLREGSDKEVIQMLPEKAGRPDDTKDSIKDSTPKQSRSAECSSGSPESVSKAGTAPDSSDNDPQRETRSVGSQTEEGLSPRRAATTSDLRCAYTQTEEKEEEDLVEPPGVSAVASSEGAGLRDGVFLGSFPIPADPARLAERIRRNRTQLSAAFDDTEYEPYGLPEVVMKGFADIPSGPSCPYIVRRGLLGTTVVPVAPKDQRHEEETD